MFTQEDVQDAYFAHRCEVIAESEGTSPEAEAVVGLEWYDDNNELDLAKTKELQAEEIARLHHGQIILEQAKLVIGNRYVRGTAHDSLVSDVAPTIRVDAGHIATSEAICNVTLILTINPKKYITLAEAAELYDVPAVTLRYHAARGHFEAEKRGKVWYADAHDLAGWMSAKSE